MAKRIVFPGNKNGVRSWQCGHFNSCLSNPGVMFGTIDFYEIGIHSSREDLICRYARVHRRVRWGGPAGTKKDEADVQSVIISRPSLEAAT